MSQSAMSLVSFRLGVAVVAILVAFVGWRWFGNSTCLSRLPRSTAELRVQGDVSVFSAEVSQILPCGDHRLLVAGSDGSAVIIDDETLTEVARFEPSRARRRGVGTIDGGKLVWVNDNGHAELVDVETQVSTELSGFPPQSRSAIAVARDGRLASFDGVSGSVWRIADGERCELIAELEPPGNRSEGFWVQKLAFTGDRLVVAAGIHGEFEIWDGVSGALLTCDRLKDQQGKTGPDGPLSVAISEVVPEAALGTTSGKVVLAGLSPLETHDLQQRLNEYLLRPMDVVAFSNDGTRLLTGTNINAPACPFCIFVWRIDSNSLRFEAAAAIGPGSPKSNPCSAALIDVRRRYLVTGHRNGIVRRWLFKPTLGTSPRTNGQR